MKTILEYFLDALEIDYTRHFAKALYQEHPHKYNMYGLKKMLDVYGVKTLGVCSNTKDLSGLNSPCILHIYGDFVIGLEYDADTVTYLQHGKKTTIGHDGFKRIWTGNALVVEETTEAVEPDYRKHQWNELISMAKTYSIPIMLILATVVGMINNFSIIGSFGIIRIVQSLVGILVCAMLMEKQLIGSSYYGDRVCSLFHHADCNSVLDGPMAKVFGISWSEIGLGYFIANILLLSLFPVSSCIVAVINWVVMPYGLWSIYYQWRIAKSWCILCIIVQAIIWAMGVTTIISYFIVPFIFNIVDGLLSCIVFTICIMVVHQYASAHVADRERIRAVQQYRSLKANNIVAKALIERCEYHETTFNDSSIIFGHPEAEVRVTILSNPHCTPCARMHVEVEKLLNSNCENICVQYIFSSFNEILEDSCRYLIAVYQNKGQQYAREIYSNWYTGEKYNHEKIMRLCADEIHTEEVEKEWKKHCIWRKLNGLMVTPTVLVNGHEFPKEYSLNDLAMVTECQIENTI